ncbi:hypothetical protein HLB44_25110 [Aquincola sp. S2]|uniref:Uncharacterized protein n=1 Tax=Pseudaquabacterium terrae TaxID=2732868 RepID=A0ABX2ENU4_9BURK|nr:hypothetical protein [Aquabacterium terrae]NRF70293.1 hypothetical protein [Aquabacterium terrae]
MSKFLIFVRRYAPFSSFGLGFEGDHRTAPSTNLNASSRTSGLVQVGPEGAVALVAFSSGTSHVGLGRDIEEFLGRWYSSVTCTAKTIQVAGNRVRFNASTSGSNPMVPFAPDIDTHLEMEIQFGPAGITVIGEVKGDTFPNAEVFIRGRGLNKLLFDYRTTADRNSGPLGLAGANETTSLGTFWHQLPLQ